MPGIVKTDNELFRAAQTTLETLREKDLYRSLVEENGVDLCSNDYLGFARHPEILSALKEGLDLLGAGSTASRLIRGHRKIYEEVEEELSSWLRAETSLFVANGYAANLGLLSAVADGQTAIFTDRKNHASILDGIRLSGAKRFYYRHLDYDQLEALLQRESKRTKKIIVTESLFSMDGDSPDLKRLVDLKNKYNTLLMMDEAHSLGVLGKSGAGLGEAFSDFVDFRVVTAGKSLGLEGAFIVTSSIWKEFLINKMRTFVFSTAPMPSIAYAVKKSVQLARLADESRDRIFAMAEYIRMALKEKGWKVGDGNSQIIPVLLESEEESLALASRLLDAGFHVKAIRPPTVDIPRLRISVNAALEMKDIKRFVEVMN